MKKKGGSVDDRPLYTRSSSEQESNDSKESLDENFKTRTLLKKSATETSVRKTDAIPNTLGSTHSGPSWERGHLDELDRSNTLPASSSLTSSISGAMVWIAPTERILLKEEVDEEEEEVEQEGGSGRGDRAAEEEDVGREWEDMTNLGQAKKATQIDYSRLGIGAQCISGSVRSHYWHPLFIARRRLGSPNVTKISTVGSPWSNGPPKNPLINACHITRSGAASSHFIHHHTTDRNPTLRLFGFTSSWA